jgi:hypothetical protein
MNILQQLRSKRQAIMNDVSAVAFFGMEVAAEGWIRPIAFENHVWMLDHGISPRDIGENIDQEVLWNMLPEAAHKEVEEAIEKLDLLAKDDKIAIISYLDRIFISLVPGMAFLPMPAGVGPALGMHGITENDFSQENFLEFFKERGFPITPYARDEGLTGMVSTYLAKDARIFGFPSMM